MHRNLWLWGPVAAWAGGIFVLSGIPDLKTELDYDFTLRKIAHVTEYLVLTGLLFRAFSGSLSRDRMDLYLCSGIAALFYAASDELHQCFVRGRTGTIEDVAIDAMGIMAFFLVFELKSRLCMSKKADKI